MIAVVSLELLAGAFGLAGAAIGGGCTVAAQRAGDRDAHAQAVWAEHQKCVAALRLIHMDLDRSMQRLDLQDERGYIELPRGAWLQYRTVLAPHLDAQVLGALVDAYNEVIEWNEILWAAFAEKPPEPFHASDQYPPDRETADAMLAGRRPQLVRCVRDAAESVAGVHEREARRTEAEVRPVGLFTIQRAKRRRLGAGQAMINAPTDGTVSVPIPL